MTTVEFLSYLQSLDIHLWMEQEQLRFSAPAGTLTQELRTELLRHKAEVIRLLKVSQQTSSTLPRIEARPHANLLPMSFAQQRLWFIDQFSPEHAVYNIPGAMRLTGRLHIEALEKSLNDIIRRHESLRTAFTDQDGQAMQVIAPAFSLALPCLDLTALSTQEQERNIQSLLRSEADFLFNLRQLPLIRTTIVRLHREEHILLLNVHHIVFDGWSLAVFFQELGSLYQARLEKQAIQLPEPPIQYADYTLWQHQWIASEAFETQLAYWQGQLASVVPLDLPTDYPRPPEQSLQGATYQFRWPQALSQNVKAFCQSTNVTPFVTLLAAFQILLHRYSGQADICVGAPVANRGSAEVEKLIGFLVNTVALRTDLSGNPSFLQVLQQVRRITLEAFANQSVPFEKVVDALAPTRALSSTPLFQMLFAFEDAPLATGKLRDLQLSPLPRENAHARFDLTLAIHAEADRLEGSLEYATDLFAERTMAALAGHLQLLLEKLIANPEQRIGEVQLFTAEAWEDLLKRQQAQVAKQREMLCLHQLFARQVERVPDRIALQLADGQLTYAALNRQANRLAHTLLDAGVGPEVRTGICAERTPELIIGILAILKAGGAYVPLDPALPLERLTFILNDTAAPVLLVHPTFAHLFSSYSGQILPLQAEQEYQMASREQNPQIAVTGDNLATTIYTSGSTGQPKGSDIVHRGLTGFLFEIDYVHLDEKQIFLPHSSISWDAFTFELWAALTYGARCVLLPDSLPLPTEYHENIETYGVTVLWLSSSLFNFIMDSLPEALVRVRQLLIGGEALSVSHIQAALQKLPFTQLINAYGPSECTAFIACYPIPPTLDVGTSIPIGSPIGDRQLWILDSYLKPVPPGLPGELCVSGPSLPRSYLHQPALTAEKLIPHPFASQPGERLYRTGDLVRTLPDGQLEFLARIDQQIKIRGYRIEPGEIEAALMQYPEVQACCIDIREDTPGSKRLIAYIVPQPEVEECSLTALRTFLRKKLPDYMVPALFISLKELPLTANGKADRHALPAPTDERPALEADFVASESLREQQLTQIWESVLGITPIGINDNFFVLGGDSILSLQIVARANQAGLHLTVKQIFEYQTIRELAALLETPQPAATHLPVVYQSEEEIPLTPIMHWFFAQEIVQRQHWNQSVILDIPTGWSASLIQQALQSVIEQHEAFRLRFVETAQGWRAHLAATPGEVPLTRITLTGRSYDEQQEQLHTETTRAQRSLDLEKGPLATALLVMYGYDQPRRLALMAHHLIVDGVSWRIILQEFAQFCEQRSKGESTHLLPEPTPWSRWAPALATFANSDTVLSQKTFWAQQERQQVATLPLDMPRGSNRMADAQTLSIELDTQETSALLHQVPELYHVQVHEVLLAALGQALTAWGDVSALVIDLEGHGREELDEPVEIARTTGWFTSLYPICLYRVQGHEVGSALKALKERLRTLPQHGLGYGLLRYISKALPEAGPVQTVFNYLGQWDQTSIGGMRLHQETAGQWCDDAEPRTHLLEINAQIIARRLQVSWTYSQQIHYRETIAQVSTAFLRHLHDLLAYCLAHPYEGYTPSDFASGHFTQAQLDLLLQNVGPDLARIQDMYHLSTTQQGLLYQQEMAREAGVYHVQMQMRIEQKLDIPAFIQSWQRVVERHPMLRSSIFYAQADMAATQIVWKQVQLPCEQQDWRRESPQGQQQKLQAYLQQERLRGFPSGQGLLWRLGLFRVAEQSYEAAWSFHHLMLDGWSMALVMDEVATCYAALTAGRPVQLKSSLPYHEYIRWLDKQDHSSAEHYWREQLRGFRRTITLPTRNTLRPEHSSLTYSNEQLTLTTEETTALIATGRAEQLTLNTMIQGMWGLLLHRYHQESDIVFGIVVSGRPGALRGVEQMVGLFINTLPLRLQIKGQQSCLTWLQEIQQQNREIQQYEYSSLFQVLHWSEVERGQPLFESILVFENYPVNEKSRAALHISDMRAADHTNYPLALIVGADRQLHLRIEYDEQRFERATIVRLLDQLALLLRALVQHPRQPLSGFPLLSAKEQLLLTQWSQGPRQATAYTCLPVDFTAQVERTPDALALVFEEEQLTYSQLNAFANQLAHYLRSLGVGPEAIIGVALERSLLLSISLLAILKAGGAYLPLDPSYPPERLSFMLTDARASIVLTTAKLRSLFESLDTHPSQPVASFEATISSEGYQIIALDSAWTHQAGSVTIGEQSTANPQPALTGDNAAYIIYTSGSTGRPKGVINTHRGISNRLQWMQQAYQLHGDDHVLHKTPISFDVSVWELFWPLLTGAQLILARPDGQRDQAYLATLIREKQITLLHFVPSMLQVFLEQAGGEDCSSVRQVICSGEALPYSLQQRFFACMPGELANLYGPTEAAVDVSAWACLAESPRPIVPIGYPINNIQLYILDEQMRQVATGVGGELYIGGIGVARGYHQRPDLTAERFVPNPFARAGKTDPSTTRLYRTGDRVRYLPDGAIEYLGRLDHQVKLRGLRIESGEIEIALEEFPDIQESLVLLREDQPDHQQLVAYIRPVPDSRLQVSEVRHHLLRQLPEYMLPAAFVLLEHFPLTPNGKIDRQALPAPAMRSTSEGAPSVSLYTPLEEILAGIWEQVLTLKPARREDNFFHIGGDSLLAMRLVSRIRATFSPEFTLRALFENPRLAQMARAIENLLRSETVSAAVPALTASSSRENLPLSFAQQRLWFLDRIHPDSAFYNVPGAIRLIGSLQVSLLEHSLQQIIQRHENLRTTFSEKEGQPAQRITPGLKLPFPLADLTVLRPEEQQEALQQIIQAEFTRPFNLQQGPLLRAHLLRLSTAEHILLLTAHHIIFDGWSTDIFFHELRTLYAARLDDRPAFLPELTLQYADFSSWQRQWLQGAVLERQLTYWKRQLSDVPTLLELPIDRPRPLVQSFRGALQRTGLPVQLEQQLRALSSQHQTTLFMTLYAAFALLLHRYSQQDILALGTPVANRTQTELEPLIGFFVNTLVLRTDFSGNPTFEQVLRDVRETTLEAYSAQDLPFERLVEELHPERTLSYSPLFQVMFAGQEQAPQKHVEFSHELSAHPIDPTRIGPGTAKFDLAMSIQETEQGLECVVEYSTDLFNTHTIERLTRHYQNLLENILRRPTQRISDLEYLSRAEAQLLLQAWNQEHIAAVEPRCLHELFAWQAALSPDAIALVDGEQQITYRVLDQRANRLAHLLQARGIRAESAVGVFMERSSAVIVGALAIMKAGGAYVPLDPAYPPERLRYICENAKLQLIITQRHLQDHLPVSLASLVPDLPDTSTALAHELAINGQATLDNLAYIIYTSGSTGQPKGVQVTHRGIANLSSAQQSNFGVGSGDRILQFASLSFDASLFDFSMALLSGAALHLIKQEDLLISSEVQRTLSEQAITLITLTPSALLTIEVGPFPSLKTIIVAGEACPPELVQRWSQGRSFFNAYGPTEATIWSSIERCTPTETKPSIGQAISNTRLYVLDKYMQPVPQGVAGELYIGGMSLGRGYLGKPALTAEYFLPDRWSNQPGSRLYRTGDRVRWTTENKLEYLGRVDHQVKVRGYRVEPGEIETILHEQTEIESCVVLVKAHAEARDKRLVAFFLLKQGQEQPEIARWRELLQSRLPDYMVPSVFVRLEQMPLTANGKIDRSALLELDLSGSETGDAGEGPRTIVEELLANLWKQLLHIKQVSIYDNFFTRGGHSLLATQLASHIRSVFSIELPLRSIFEAPTLVRLAQNIEQVRSQTDPGSVTEIKPVAHQGDIPLSFAQQRLWFLDHLESHNPAYLIPIAIKLQGKLEQAALEKSLGEIVRRHGSLRTSFPSRGTYAAQVITPGETFTLLQEDLSLLPPGEREIVVQQCITAEAASTFDLSSGPLFKSRLLKTDGEEHILLITMHHIVADGWSMQLFLQELSILYKAFKTGQGSPLAELPIQYTDFALWQQQWLQGENLARQARYWKKQLAQSAPLNLPTDYARPALQSYRGQRQLLLLPQALTDALQQIEQREHVTPFMLMLASVQCLLARYTGQADITVGTTIANRNRAETDELIGFFVNTLVLRGDLSGQQTFNEFLQQVRETTLAAYEHQDIPFEKLVDILQPERDLSISPVFQVMFVLQHLAHKQLELEGLTCEMLALESQTSKFDLTFSVEESEQGLYCGIEYNSDLFAASSIARMLTHWQVLLEGIVVSPWQRLDQLSVLTEIERECLLNEWNATERTFLPTVTGLQERFVQQAGLTPDAVAVVFQEQSLTYGELYRRANQLASYLRTCGVQPETLAGIYLERSPEMLIGLLAVLLAGGAYVPLDPAFPNERLAFMLQDAHIEILLTQQSLASNIQELESALQAHQTRVLYLDTDREKIELSPEQIPVSLHEPDNAAYVIYTSGSSGQPKGVVIEHRSVINFLHSMQDIVGLAAEDTFFAVTTLSFDIAALELFLPLSTGARIVLASRESLADGTQLNELLESSGATAMQATPATWKLLLATGWSGQARLKILCGGDALTQELAHQLAQRSIGFWNVYGPTETTIWSTFADLSRESEQISIGRPLANTHIYLLDPSLQPVPVGVPGELYIAGQGLARTYLHRPDLTAERFVPHPFSTSPGARLYRTGDLARYQSNGTIECLGRIDQQVKLHGYRIEPGEIEARLNQHPAIGESVVIIRADSSGEKRLVAYLVAREQSWEMLFSDPALAEEVSDEDPDTELDDFPSASELRAHLQNTLPDYMLPSVFMLLESLPLTPNQKIDRQALPDPDSERLEIETPYAPPRNQVEETIISLWQKILRIEQVGIYDNFFELGGDSLLSVEFVNKARAEGLPVTVQQLFQHQTSAELAAIIPPAANA